MRKFVLGKPTKDQQLIEERQLQQNEVQARNATTLKDMKEENRVFKQCGIELVGAPQNRSVSADVACKCGTLDALAACATGRLRAAIEHVPCGAAQA